MTLGQRIHSIYLSKELHSFCDIEFIPHTGNFEGGGSFVKVCYEMRSYLKGNIFKKRALSKIYCKLY